MPHKHPRLLFLIVLLLFLLIGCQQNTAEAEATSHGDDHDHETAHTESTNKLVIYSGRTEDLVQPIIDQFSELSGIEVEVVYGDTSEIAANLLEEGEDSPADIFYAADPGGLGTVEELGLLTKLPDEILAKVPEKFSSDSGEWVGISGRARVVVYNNEKLTEADLPDDMWGFTEPEWKGRIGWAPTNGSFQAMVTAMRATWGEEETSKWLSAIQANEPVIYEKNTPIVEAVANGEVDVGFVNHYYLYRFIETEGDSFPVRNYFLPGGGPGSLVMVAGAGILKNAQNVENAERFINYLLSVPNQQYFASQTYEYPLVEGVNMPALFQPFAEITAMAIDIPLNHMSDLLGTAVLLEEAEVMP